MTPIVFALPGSEAMARRVAEELGAVAGKAGIRRFPDGETYVRLHTLVARKPVAIVACLDRPDAKFLPLSFLAGAARDLGALSVGLVCPYLPYMRQDKRFNQGEAVTSAQFAALLGRSFDWLVTVDPHLHRRKALSEIYRIPTRVVHAAPRLADWIRRTVPRPLIIGPDRESAQWVEAVARGVDAPWVVLKKRRSGDRAVTVSRPDLDKHPERISVLVDDVISSGRTMIETVRQIRANGGSAPWCAAVHGIFADKAYEELHAAGAAKVVTSNTLPHPSNAIDVADLLAEASRQLLEGQRFKRRNAPARGGLTLVKVRRGTPVQSNAQRST